MSPKTVVSILFMKVLAISMPNSRLSEHPSIMVTVVLVGVVMLTAHVQSMSLLTQALAASRAIEAVIRECINADSGVAT